MGVQGLSGSGTITRAAAAVAFCVFALACTGTAFGGPAIEVSRVSPRSFLGAAGGKIVFTVDEPDRTRVWISDGTPRGTRQLPGLDLGPSGRGVGYAAELANKVVFMADDGTHGFEWWVTDGTVAGTKLLVDAFPGEEGQSTSFHPARVADQVLMKARDPEHGVEWWRTDGTPSGTRLVADVNPGPAGSVSGDWLAPDPPVSGGLLYFMAAAPGQDGWKLWRTDGTQAGTISLGVPWDRDGLVGAGHGGELYFTDRSGRDPEGADIWRSDGTPEGTGPFATLDGPGEDVRFEEFAFAAGHLFFSSYYEPQTIWASDGTSQGTRPLLLPTSTPGSYHRHLEQLGERAIFIRGGTEGGTLFTTDGSPAGTTAVKGIPESGYPDLTRVVGDTAIFDVYDNRAWIWTLAAGERVARPIRAVGTDDELAYTDGAGVGDVFYFAGMRHFKTPIRTSLWKIDLGDSEVALSDQPVIPRRQRARGRKNIVRAKVKGSERLDARLSGTVYLHRRWRPLRGKRKSSQAAAPAHLRLATRNRRDWSLLRKRLNKSGSARVRLKLKLTDGAGNSRRTKRLIRVR